MLIRLILTNEDKEVEEFRSLHDCVCKYPKMAAYDCNFKNNRTAKEESRDSMVIERPISRDIKDK